MIKAVLVDDEPDALKNLKWELERFCPDVKVLDVFTSPEEAVSAINYLKPDCLFLDIEMPEMDGFSLLEQLKFRDFDLIITTAYDNYAIRAFRKHAIAYLLKPVDTDELRDTMERVRQHKASFRLGDQLKLALSELGHPGEEQKVPLPLAGRNFYVRPGDILYCKAEGNYTEVHLRDGGKQLLTRKLKFLEELLGGHPFFRVHKSYLVNTRYIEEFVFKDGPYILLENAVSLPVSRSKKQDLLDLLER